MSVISNDTLDKLARIVDREVNGSLKGKKRTTGFVLLVFPTDERLTLDQIEFRYISNIPGKLVPMVLGECAKQMREERVVSEQPTESLN